MTYNILRTIREKKGLSTKEMAEIIGVSRTSLYAIERQNPLKNKYLQKIQHLLDNDVVEQNATIQQNDTQQITEERQQYYDNVCKLAQNAGIDIDINDQVKKILTHHSLQDGNISISLIKNDNDIFIVDNSSNEITNKPSLFVVKNTVGGHSITFFSTLKLDELTGKIIMKLESGVETAMSETCKIIGRVISKIVSV